MSEVIALRSAGNRRAEMNDDTRAAMNAKNLLLLIYLRWIAVVGQIATIVVVHFHFGIALPSLKESNELTIDADCVFSHTGAGLHRFVDPSDDAVYLYTQFETADAKRVFACFDQPDLKAEFDFSVTASAAACISSTASSIAPIRLVIALRSNGVRKVLRTV